MNGGVVGMLEARLALVDRMRRVEHRVAREEHARAAAMLVRARGNALDNEVRTMKLAALELEQRLGAGNPGRLTPEEAQLVADLRAASEQVGIVLAELLDAAHPVERTTPGPAVAPVIRAAVQLARTAVAGEVQLSMQLTETIATRASADELETIVIASVLDAATATEVSFVVRTRDIQGGPWIELIRTDDRDHDIDVARAFEPCTMLHLVEHVARQAGGEVTLVPGRIGTELAIALPAYE